MNGLLRAMPAVLAAAMALALWAACGQEPPAPPPTATTTAASPTETVAAATLPPVSPVAPAENPTGTPVTTALSTPATTATPLPTVAPAGRESGGASLRLIRSRSATAPSSGLLRIVGGSHRSVLPQTAPTAGGLTVSAIGSVTVAADEAYVVVVPEQRFSSSGPEQMTDEDRQQIRENLAGIGVPEEAVEFENLARYGPSSISVEVGLDELAKKGGPILDAVEQVIRRYETNGVIYSLSEENCEDALSLARREAIPRSERAADDLAQALGVNRGMVIGALEYPLTTPGYGLAGISAHGCGGQASSPYPNLVPFDAEPEVEVTVGLQITYSIR